jgi:hypothetical protein
MEVDVAFDVVFQTYGVCSTYILIANRAPPTPTPLFPCHFRSSSRFLTPTVPHPEEEDDKNEKGEKPCYE